MLKLMKLELRRNSLKAYNISTATITVVMLAMVYLFANIPSLEPGEADIDMFTSYINITTLVCVLSMASFAILSATMYSRFVVEEYAGKRAVLLFSYPVSRKRIFNAKIAVVFAYTFLAMLVSCVCVFGVFYLTEAFRPIVQDSLSLLTVAKTLGLIAIYSALAGILGILSLLFGMIKKSVPATIISEVVIIAVLCNVFMLGMGSVMMPLILAVAFAVIVSIVHSVLARRVSVMEV